jgi:hypothetical protein
MARDRSALIRLGNVRVCAALVDDDILDTGPLGPGEENRPTTGVDGRVGGHLLICAAAMLCSRRTREGGVTRD